MTKVLVLYYSSWGHIEQMADAVAEGVRETGAQVAVKCVPELMSEDAPSRSHCKLHHNVPVATVEELADYDAIIFGTPTYFGMMSSQMKNFLDRTSSLWMQGKLVGKVGAVFSSSGSQHGGQEATILSFLTVLMHHGMVPVGLPYSFQGQMGIDEVLGCSPYGATTITGSDGSRQPSQVELDGARFQGRHVAQIAAKLAAQNPVYHRRPRQVSAKVATPRAKPSSRTTARPVYAASAALELFPT